MNDQSKHAFRGTVRLEGTAGKFSELVNDNTNVFQGYFGVQIFPGSLNVNILDLPTIHQDLDNGKYEPAFVIPHSQLVGQWNPPRLGDGQAWKCTLAGAKFPQPVSCWVFRRIHSTVPTAVLEIVAPPPAIVTTNSLCNGDPITLTLFEGA